MKSVYVVLIVILIVFGVTLLLSDGLYSASKKPTEISLINQVNNNVNKTGFYPNLGLFMLTNNKISNIPKEVKDAIKYLNSIKKPANIITKKVDLGKIFSTIYVKGYCVKDSDCESGNCQSNFCVPCEGYLGTCHYLESENKECKIKVNPECKPDIYFETNGKEQCNTSLDEDGDGYIDCQDTDCANTELCKLEIDKSICCINYTDKTCRYIPYYSEGSCNDAKIVVGENVVCKNICKIKNYNFKKEYDYYKQVYDILLVCEKPCPFSTQVLDYKLKGIVTDAEYLKKLLKADFTFSPVIVHYKSDSDSSLGAYVDEYNTYGDWKYYPTKIKYVHKIPTGNFTKPNISLYAYEKSFKDSNYLLLTPDTQSVVGHELGHAITENRMDTGNAISEGLVETFNRYIVHVNVDKDNLEYQTMCYKNNPLFSVLLCNKYGFDFDDLPELFDKIDAKYMTSGKGVIDQELKNILDEITNQNTAEAFYEIGVTDIK